MFIFVTRSKTILILKIDWDFDGFQFFQLTAAKVDVKISTDYGLVDIKACIDGAFSIYGIGIDEVAGDTLAVKYNNMLAMGSEEFLSLVNDKGFSCFAQPGVRTKQLTLTPRLPPDFGGRNSAFV